MTVAFLYGHAFDVGWGIATALIGALFGFALEALIGSGIGRNPIIRQTVVIQTSAPKRGDRVRRRRKRAAILDEDDKRLVAAVVAISAVVLYLRWRSDISYGLTVAALLVLGFSVGMAAYALLRIGLRWLELSVVVAAIGVVAIGFLDGRALARPSFDHGRYASLVRAFDHGGLRHVIDLFGAGGVLFVLYQVVGVVFLVVSNLLVVAALLFVLGRVNVELGARGRWLWAALERVSRESPRRPAMVIAMAVVFAAVSYPLCSGAAYNAIHKLVRATSPGGSQAGLVSDHLPPGTPVE